MRFKVASRVRGLSDEAFREAFGAEEQCRSALVRLRWPDGFLCPSCGHRGHCVLAGRGLYQCNRCKKQTSPTAGTIFHATKLPLTLWFAAIHLIVTAKNGISSVELGRRLGVKQPTAWAVKHKIMAVMARREGETPLSGRVEMDDAYLGGVRSGGKRGRGAAGKTPFVAAVSTSPEGRPRKLKLAPVKGFRKREIARGAKHWLAPGTAVVTDGLGCWSALDETACSHQAIRTGSGRKAARVASFKWVNTTLGNIKCAITGTYRKLGPDHAGRYLASFAWRYNRRYQLETMIPRFVHSAARTEPMPYRLVCPTFSLLTNRLSTDVAAADYVDKCRLDGDRRHVKARSPEYGWERCGSVTRWKGSAGKAPAFPAGRSRTALSPRTRIRSGAWSAPPLFVSCVLNGCVGARPGLSCKDRSHGT